MATGTFEREGYLYLRFMRCSFLFHDVQMMVHKLEIQESSAQSVLHVPPTKCRKLKKEEKTENFKEEKRRKVEHSSE